MSKKKHSAPQHAVVMGDPARNIAQSTEGRAAKKKARQAAAAAKEETAERERARERVKLVKSFDQLSGNYASMLAGNPGEYGIRLTANNENLCHFGMLCIEVQMRGRNNGLPSLVVTRSTFDLVPPSVENFLPIETLHHSRLKDVGQGARVFSWQYELHTALRRHLRDEIRQMADIRNAWAKKLPTPAIQQVVKEETCVLDDEVDVTGHKPFTAAIFMTRTPVGIFTSGNEGDLSFFRTEKIAGATVLRLIAADEDSPLASCLEKHESVYVHLQDLRKNDRPYGDISEMKHAREKVRQHLRAVAFALGIRPKQQQQQQQAA